LGKVNSLKTDLLTKKIKIMIENLNLIKADISNRKCLTFKEAEIILKPMLDGDCLQEFLEKIGYIDCNGLPEKSHMMRGDLFCLVNFDSDHAEFISPGVVYWITQAGIVSMFKQALKYYHKEKVVKDTDRKLHKHVIQIIEGSNDCFVF
jgi:hypothetical protein